jgi:multidrug efflux pump subunit AcrA (membrane-fusion protein)
MKKFLKVFVALVIIGGLAGGGWFGYNYYINSQQRSAFAANMGANMTRVATERAARSDVQDIVSASGVVYLKNDVSIYSTATDVKVSEVLVEVGDSITDGQELVRYDVDSARKTLEKQIRQAEINLTDQKLSLESMTLPPT